DCGDPAGAGRDRWADPQRSFANPVAASKLSHPGMDSLEAIRRAQATRLVSEDGDEVELELAPGLPRADTGGPPAGGHPAPFFPPCHDPPVVLYQSPNIGDFLHEAFQMLVPPHA